MITKLLRHRALGLAAAGSAGSEGQTQGFTLIECLVAIIMVALVASAIAPALVISVATRVHSQKAEQALALAQSEIERTRVLVERGVYVVADLPPVAAVTDANIDGAPAPANLLTDLSVASATATQARPVDPDNDGEIDFFVQRFRGPGQEVSGLPIAFAMGVRVYDSAAVAGTLSTDPASLSITGSNSGRSTRPMAALYTTIAASDQGDSMCNMITYFNRTDPAPDTPLPPLCN